MPRPRLFKDPEKRKRVVHIGAGITIMFHAYENYETGHHSYQLFAIAGIIVLLLAIFHHAVEKKLPWIDGAFFFIESVLSSVIAYDLFHHGKKALPFVYIVLAMFQVFMAFRMGRKGLRGHHAKKEEKPSAPSSN